MKSNSFLNQNISLAESESYYFEESIDNEQKNGKFLRNQESTTVKNSKENPVKKEMKESTLSGSDIKEKKNFHLDSFKYTRQQSLFVDFNGKIRKSNKKKIHVEKKNEDFSVIVLRLNLIKKFVDKLRQGIGIRRPNLIKKYHANIIQDNSFFYEIFKKMMNFKQYNSKKNNKIIEQFSDVLIDFSQKFKRIINKKSIVFDPSHKFKIFWDLNKFLIIIFYFFFIPLELGLNVSLTKNLYLKISSISYFSMDILLNFNTAFFKKGKLCFVPLKIIKNYIKSGFFIIDAFSLYTFIFSNTNILHVVFFLQFFYLKKLMKNLQQYLFVDEKILNYLNLLKLLFSMIMLSHIFACIWLFIGKLENDNTWIIKYELDRESLKILYLHAYYFVVITMNTVGYGSFFFLKNKKNSKLLILEK